MDLEKAIKEAVTRLEVQCLDAFEVVGLTERSLVIEAKKQMIDRAVSSERRGISIRAIKGGRMGVATTADMNPRSVVQAVKGAVDSAASVAPSEEAVLPAPQAPHGAVEDGRGRAMGDVGLDEKRGLALSVESAALASDSRVSRVQKAVYGEEAKSLIVVNSHGIDSRFERGICYLSARVAAEAGGSAESGHDLAFSASFDDLNAESLGRAAAKRAVVKLGARPAAGGRIPVIFEPRAAASMLSLLAPSFFADNVQRGKSAIAGRLGERAYSASVSVIDDGILPNGCNSFAFDWEGVPRRRTIMVREGTIDSWLYDAASAAKDGVCSTGNSYRESLDRQPAVGTTNCFLKAGSAAPSSLLSDAGQGVLVTDLIGLHTANTISGAFSLGIEGFIIAGGAKGDPVRGMTIAGSVHDLFNSVVALGNDLVFTGPCGAPSLFVEGIMAGS